MMRSETTLANAPAVVFTISATATETVVFRSSGAVIFTASLEERLP